MTTVARCRQCGIGFTGPTAEQAHSCPLAIRKGELEEILERADNEEDSSYALVRALSKVIQERNMLKPYEEAIFSEAKQPCRRTTTHCHSQSNNPDLWCPSCWSALRKSEILG